MKRREEKGLLTQEVMPLPPHMQPLMMREVIAIVIFGFLIFIVVILSSCYY